MTSCSWRSQTFDVRMDGDGTIPDLAAGEAIESSEPVPFTNHQTNWWSGVGRATLEVTIRGGASLYAALNALRDGVSGDLTFHDSGSGTKTLDDMVLRDLGKPAKYARSSTQTWLFRATWYQDSPP